MVTVVLYTVYNQMVQAFSTTGEARQYIARMARHFTLAEIYADGKLIDSLHLAGRA